MEYKTFRERLQESISNAVYRSEFPEPGGSWSPSRKYGQMNWEWKSWVFVLLLWSEMKRLIVILLVLEDIVVECVRCGALWSADCVQFHVTLYSYVLQVFRILQWCTGGLQSSGIWCLVSGWLVSDISTQHGRSDLKGSSDGELYWVFNPSRWRNCTDLKCWAPVTRWCGAIFLNNGDVTLFCFKRVLSYFHTSAFFLILYRLKWYIPVED